MCKVSSVTGINDKNRDLVWIFMQHLGQLMSVGNSDGLGYAAFDKDSNLFGERWLINKTAFTDLSFVKGLNAQKMNKLYSFFGNKVAREEVQGMILHTRFATCGKGIQNTHPFVNDIDSPEIAIIHNGIISNDNEFKKKYSTCDSEVLAHLYDEHGVKNSLSKINEFTAKLEGWFTVLNLSKTDNGRMVMDAYTENGRLYSYFLPDLNVRVWATSDTDIEKTAKFFDLKYTDLLHLKAGTAVRVDVLTNEIIDDCKVAEAKRPVYFPFLEGNVHYAEGNLDDEEFQKLWFDRMRR